MEKALSVNCLAWKLLEKLLENSELYGVKVEKTRFGATIVDAGIEVQGGFEAGRLITEICMGGCANVNIRSAQYGELVLPSIFVYTDHPVIATLGSQYAGWQINKNGYFAIGSGPARALALKPKEIYNEIKYRDSFNRAIVILETDKSPPDWLIERFSKDCNVPAGNVVVILTPTVSIVGATQVSGRIVETGIHKLRKLGLDVNTIRYACGIAPIPPTHPKFTKAMARTNDAILYGGAAYYSVDCDDEEALKSIVDKAPSKASKSYGKPFIEIFKEANYDFYKIDSNLFAPAVMTINNLKTGNTFKKGEINIEALMKSFGFQI
jgi:methenyltetrahydromethanopterin cyclohydrolase